MYMKGSMNTVATTSRATVHRPESVARSSARLRLSLSSCDAPLTGVSPKFQLHAVQLPGYSDAPLTGVFPKFQLHAVQLPGYMLLKRFGNLTVPCSLYHAGRHAGAQMLVL